ncbi:MAG: uracil permease [Lasallia pustulata]|uniref:Uracil permease n=1 Tax=Lasallia pustulata TaxID=136370 RepID=A0A5M8PE74_9LECA|nr:MAG: uracil permease [Lasallia pustulata]
MEKLHTSGFARAVDKLAVSSEPGLSNAQLMLTNHDLKPVEPERRQWGAWNFVGFWIADSFNINTWMISSSMIVGGLSWWQSWLCVWFGYLIAAVFICLTGRIGATYHISFPVVSRASFGVWGSLWPVFNRAAMACIWYGVQAWIGGECVTIMIRAIWSNYENLPNGLPVSSGTNTRDFLSFFLFWLCSLPAIWFPVHKIRHLFTVKAYFVPVAGFVYFIWAIVKAHGIGPIIHQPNTIHGSDLAWAMVKGIMSSIANFATLIVNDPDFARFARKPRDALWSQLITIPVGFAVTSFIGIIVSSSSNVIYGQPIWNPLSLLSNFLIGASSGERFGVFVIATAFALAQLGTNIAANSVSAGTDMTALLPRYLNIRRGGYICAAVGLAMCPWNLLSSSNQFTVYLSAYSVFLSSIAGVILSDYYFVRKGFYQIKDLYSARKESPYYFWFGFHWRGYFAYIAGILINIVGFVGAIGRKVPIGAQYIYDVNFFCGFIVASGSYYLLCRFFPIPATSDRWNEVGDEILDVHVAYDASEVSDEENATGSDHKSDGLGVRERKTAAGL